MSLRELDEPTRSVARGAAQAAAPRRPQRAAWLVAALLVSGLLTALIADSSVVRFALQTQRAAQLLERGLSWPQPRQSDTLPLVADPVALTAAREALLSAEQLRPESVSTLRQLGTIYAAQGQWSAAVDVLERAARLEPKNPLAAWELGLVYERLSGIVTDASDLSLMNQLAGGEPNTPGAPPATPYCVAGSAASCAVRVQRVYQRFAGLPNAVGLNARTLMVVPPASQRLTLVVPANRPVLSFAVGLDPAARSGQTDGATMRVSVLVDGQTHVVYAQTLARGPLLSGWVPALADLTPWADREVTLVFASEGGPGGSTAGDWVGFSNVLLTSRVAAEAALYAPRSRAVDAWRRAGLTPQQFLARAAEARGAGHLGDAQRWEARAREMTLP